MQFNRVATLGACALLFVSASVLAQSEDGKKPPMYTYYSTWTFPRAKWGDVEKQGRNKTIDQAFAAGKLIGYGSDETVVHSDDGQTHDSWFSAMSIRGLLNTLSDLMQGGTTKTNLFDSATKHSDMLLVSRYYNWKAGNYAGAYTRSATYKVKDSAPDDAIDTIAKNCMVPFLEKELAAGKIIEYELDEQALHTDSPAVFYLDWTTPTADGQDQVLKDLNESHKSTPLCGPTIESWLNYEVHRDLFVRGEVVYK
jgi:hypothetical protein